jgi:glycosyltransferase involved in cell wall biosynthesis
MTSRKDIDKWVKKADVVFTMLMMSPSIVPICHQHAVPVANFICDEICFANPIIKKSIRSCQILIANSEFTKNNIETRMNKESFVSFPEFNKENSTIEAVKKEGKTALFFNPVIHKGYGVVKHLIRKFPDVNFLIVGTDKIDPLNRCVVERIDSQKVEYLECTEDKNIISSFYERADVTLVPSQVPETFSMVSAESIWRKVPVLGSNFGALSETIGKAGILVDNFRDVNQWEKDFEKILSSDAVFDFETQLDYFKSHSSLQELESYIASKLGSQSK